MPKRLEVRATVSFGVFREGRVYDIDIEDGRMMSLLGVGYLEPTSDLEEDHGRDDLRDSAGTTNLRDVRTVGSPGSETVGEGKTDVADRSESGSDKELGARKGRGGRIGLVDANAPGGTDSGPAGKS